MPRRLARFSVGFGLIKTWGSTGSEFIKHLDLGPSFLLTSEQLTCDYECPVRSSSVHVDHE